jgi:hypothetical protein
VPSPPDVSAELFARDDITWMGQQVEQNLIRLARQPDPNAIFPKLAGARIDDVWAKAQLDLVTRLAGHTGNVSSAQVESSDGEV